MQGSKNIKFISISSVSRKLRYVLCMVALLASVDCMAQFEVSSGIDLTYPVLINSSNAKLNYGQIGFGIKGGIAYKPEEIQFFPMLNVAFGRTRLPIKQVKDNVIAQNFNYLNVMLNENFVIEFPNSELYIYGGVGFSYLMGKRLTVAGPQPQALRVTLDSLGNPGKIFPAMNLGFEYNYGESKGKPMYITMGINFQYILLLQERNSYFLTVDDRTTTTKYQADFTGGVISPSFYLALHYLLGKKK